MLAAPFKAGRQPEQFIFTLPFSRDDRNQFRFAFGDRPRLVHHERINFGEGFERLGIFDSTPSVAPRPVPTIMLIGVARPSAHGHAMISTATALTSACASRGSGPYWDHTKNVA